ncbi:MAG: hypothetical protein CR991_06275 [Proteobacteria bacterium]|nr:MAG: hypothetical protein CR991_06275 [Pseudomonadota bacterium]
MIHHPLHRFMLRVVLFFPLAFFVWYVSARWHLAPVTWLTGVLLDVFFPESVLWLKLEGHYLILASNFGHDAVGNIVSPPPAEDLLGFHLNPLIYGYSLPLLAALILAVSGQDKWLKLLAGLCLLLPVEVFSMFFSVLKTLTFDVGAAFQQQQSITTWQADIIAMAYQSGTLLLPMIAPLIIWMALNRDFIVQLAPRLQPVLAK